MNQIISFLNRISLVTHDGVHSWESLVTSIVIALISLALFFYWTKRKALINFRAWALLLFTINFVTAIHYSPFGPHFCIQGIEYQLSLVSMNFLEFLEYLTSAVTIFRLWQVSEKYVPFLIVEKIEKTRQKREDGSLKRKNHTSRIKARVLALFHTIKNGGNNEENTRRIKQNIAKSL
jgi:glucan phosphoethanolaminetransferase (alkaline phosphatase superfamily)